MKKKKNLKVIKTKKENNREIFYRLNTDLNLEKLNKSVYIKKPEQHEMIKYQKALQKWNDNSKKGEKPKLPEDGKFTSSEFFRNMLEYAIISSYKQSGKKILKMTNNIFNKFTRAMETKDKIILLSEKEFNFVKEVFDKCETWENIAPNRIILEGMDSAIEHAVKTEVIK